MANETAVEQFLAAVMSDFPDELKECLRAGRRPWSKLPLIDGVPVPSARILSLFVVAGLHRLSLSAALEQTEKNGSLFGALRRANDQVLGTLTGGSPFSEAWLTPLSIGLHADRDQHALLMGFVGMPGGLEVPIAENIGAHLQVDSHRVHRLAVEYASKIIEGGLLAPRDYPPHMTVSVLAQALTASRLPADWTKQWESVTGLYSDSDYSAEARPMPAVDVAAGNVTTILLGDPGHGKSTVLAAMAAKSIEAGNVGLLIRFTDLGRSLKGRIRLSNAIDVLEAAITAAGDRAGKYASRTERDALLAAFDHHIEESVLLFDGLDELPSAADLPLVRRSLELLNAAQIRVVISSRLTGYTTPIEGAPEYLVKHLHKDDIDSFVSSWFSSPTLRQFESRARKVTDAESIVAIPLVVGFVCMIAEHDDVATTLHGLYTQYLELFLQRTWKDEEYWVSVGGIVAKLNAATEVALAMAAPGVENRSRSIANQADPPIWMDNATPQFLSEQSRIPPGFASLLGPDGLLVAHSAAGPNRFRQSYRWIHRTIHEHLAGRALAIRLRDETEDWLPFFRQVMLRPRTWRVTLAHTAGFLSDFGVLEPAVDSLIAASTLNRATRVKDDPLLEGAASLLIAANNDHRRNELAELFARAGEISSAMILSAEVTLHFWHTVDLDSIPIEHVQRALGYLSGSEGREPEWALVDRLVAHSGFKSQRIIWLWLSDQRAGELAALALMRETPIASPSVADIVSGSIEMIDKVIALVVQEISSIEPIFYISTLARNAWELARPRLASATQHLGAIGPFVIELLDREHEGSSRPFDVGDENAMALLTEIVPPWVAYAFAAQGAMPEDFSSMLLSPWARAGLAMRLVDENNSPDGDWSGERSNRAIDALFLDFENPTPAVLAEMWSGVQWALRNRWSERAAQILEIYYANDIGNWHWWAMGAFPLRDRLTTFNWEELFEVVRERGRQAPNDPDLMLLGEALFDAPGSIPARLDSLFAFAVAEFPSVDRFEVRPKFVDRGQLRAVTRRFLDSRRRDRSRKPMALAQVWVVATWLLDQEILDEFWDEIVAINEALTLLDQEDDRQQGVEHSGAV